MIHNITEIILDIQKEYNVKILYACECGSRAYEMHSEKSDYDVKFIYIHNRDWYLSFSQKRDVIEIKIDNIDIVGFDIKKALMLIYKSNPSIIEWMQSPIVYFRDEMTYNVLKKVQDDCLSLVSYVYHHLGIAYTNYKKITNNLKNEINIKSYLYTIRSILCCKYVYNHKKIPPLDFNVLLNELEDETLIKMVKMLLSIKQGDIPAMDARNPTIDMFIDDNIDKSKYEFDTLLIEKPKPDIPTLDKVFIDILNMANNGQ